MVKNVTISTDFASGGGEVSIHQIDPLKIRFTPHNEGRAGWSQVWWYFLLDGVSAGEEITLELDRGDPKCEGISPQVFFSYDQKSWGLTNTGRDLVKEGRDFFIYKHTVRGSKVWFAYDLPYTTDHVENILVPLVHNKSTSKVITLCKTRNNRTNLAFNLKPYDENTIPKYGIWLQARAHAFESGSSWVLHELTKWLLSNDPKAVALRNSSDITIVPIVDVDGVTEGRTGKYQEPHDHWMRWGDDPSYWPEVGSIKSNIENLAQQNLVDLFIDFHGPGGLSHPYFIIPYSKDLYSDKQRKNRSQFFDVLNAKELDENAKLSQSMNQIHYSERAWDNKVLDSSHEWVTANGNDHTIAFTIEVNMNTPLSTQDGYHSEALTLGRAISNYFVNGRHEK